MLSASTCTLTLRAMVKRNEPLATEADDDALFAPGSWDIGPPSARRSSLRPSARNSMRPQADSLAPKVSKAPKAPSIAPEPSSAPTLELAAETAADAPPEAQLYEAEPDSVSGARLVRPSRRAPSATPSLRPVVPEPVSKLPPRRRPSLRTLLPLASLLLSSAGIGFLLFGGSGPSDDVEPAKAPAALTEPAKAALPSAPAVGATRGEAPRSPATPDKALPPAHAEAAAPGQAKGSEQTAANAVVGSTRVELEVFPPDAAVGYLGIMQKGGPRYGFDVPHGKKIAVEVARKGYGTRKVTLDGSQTKLSIGLRKSQAAP